jgi:hypothetical protein
MTDVTIKARSDQKITKDKAASIVASGGYAVVIASDGQHVIVDGGNFWEIVTPRVSWVRVSHTDAEGAYLHSEVVKIASRIARAAGKASNSFSHLPPWVSAKLDAEVTKCYSPAAVCQLAALAYHDGDRTYDSAWRYAIARTMEGDQQAAEPPFPLWACGCLQNEGGAHRVGCPDHPEGVRA